MKIVKRALTFFLSAMLTMSAWAVPAYRGWQERTLTDGTPITIRQIGDEFYHFWETQDGKIALEQADGTFVLSDEQAPSNKQVIARRKAAAQRKGAARVRKNYGAIQPTKLLVLLVNFSDKSMKSAHNKAFFENLLNGSFPSVQDYFKQSSGNTYIPEFDVFGPYTLSNNMAYYGANDSQGNDEHPDQMVVDACALAYADGCNFSNYDTNGDGKVDNIYVIYAGYGEAAGAPANTIWPHSWEIYSQYVTGTLTYNGKTLGHYACSAELSGKSGSNSDGVGTFAHEFSHVIGLPDYYDTDYGTNSDNYVTPGEWTLMDQGSYNGNGQYPPLYSAYDKYFMGWMTPKFLAKDEVKSVTLTTTWNDNYQITGGAARVACTNTNTVYYIENRQKSGYDQYLPGHGMVVWKVTYNSNRWNNNDLNNTAGTLRYTIVPADGKTKNYGQASDPFPGTSNKKTWTPFTGCALTEITESSGNINFSYNGGVPKTTWDYVLYGENCTYPADGEVDKGSKLELTITPSSGYTLADPACWDVQMGGIKLTYGTDFTYNAGTNKFTINSVTGDVEIIVESGRTVNWYVQGALYKTNVSVGGTITLPDAPANCSASRPLVGWCTNSTYKSPDTPPAYAKTGDAYSVANYYAVYADVSGGGSADASYTFTSKSWAASPSDWTSGKDGTAYLNSGVQVTTGTTGANATCPTSYSNISSIVVSYCTNSSKGAGSIKLSVDGTEVSESVTSEGGTTPRDLEFDFSETKPSGAPVITVNCGTNSIYVCGLIINYGGASYSGFSTDCSAPDPCALTSLSLNTTNVQTAFTTGETFSSEGLVVTANYSNCSSKIVTPTSVSTPDMSSDGNKTVTVSYTENAVTKTATYPIMVSAPTTYAIRFFDGTTKLKEESQTLGATATPPTVDDCEEYDFVGWWTDPLSTTNTTSHTWVETFTVSGAQDYYAVYSHSEGGSSSTPSTETYGFEDADDATNWTITGPVKDSGKAASGTYAGKINTNHTYIEYKNKVKVTNFSFKLARTSTNSNYNVYVETSSDGSTWTAAETYAMNSFANGSFTSKSKDFDGKTELYVRFHCYNTTAVRYVDDISITYGGGSSSTTYYTTTKDCTIPTEVTVKFEANGGEGTMTDQTIDYNTATALKANTFERTGYTFLGWATSSTGEKVYDDEEEVTLTQKETTLYAVWEKNSWKVYFTTPSGATSVTANGETTSPLTIEYGETVIIVITPDAEHTISTVTATGGAILSGEGGTRTFSMPDADVVLSITMVEKSIYTINFINMGETISSQQVMDGQAAVKPSDPEACEGYSFYGWWTAELGTDNTTAQKVDAYTATGNQDYYAVYSHTESGSGSSAASKTFDFATLATAGSWTDGSYHTTIAETPVTLTANGGGNNGRYYVSDKSWRLYNGGSVTISVADGEVTSVSSSPSKTFTISNGEASLSLSATTKFTSITVNYTVGSSSNTYYTTVPNCTPCEDKVNLTKGTDSNGTFTLDKVNGDYNNCTSDFIVTVSDIEAAEGYRFVNVTATGGNNEVTGPDGNGNYTVTYTKGNNITSIVTANFELIPSHTVTWSINGDDSNTASYQEGKAIVFPQTASGCAGKEFMGWSASTVAETDIAPTYVTSALMGDHDVTYYAVFATASSGSSGAWDGSTGGTYKIYAQVDDTKYYAAGTGAKITGTTNAAEATDYTFTKVSGGWTIQAGETYITYSSSTNLGTSGSAYTWELSSGVKGTHRLTSETAGRAWIFRAGTTNKFGGYATSNVTASGTEYFDLEIGGGSTTTYSGYTTSCTECLTKVTLTKGDETNGTFTLNKDDGEYNNCTADFVVTISGITPAEGYYCSGVTATGGDNVAVTGPDGSGNYTVTYTKGNSITSTIIAIFEEIPSYTVTWDVAGTTSTETHYAGVALEGIPAPTSDDCDGLKKFVGWTATANYSSEDTAPADLFTDPTTKTTPDNNTTTYYAVFAEEDSGSGEIVKATSIAVGDIVYLVYEEDLYELSGISTTSTKYGIGTHYSTIPAGLYPLEVVEGNDAGRVAFKHGSSYLNLGGNSNSLSTASSVTANSSWTVSFSSGNAVIANVAISTRSIRWNSTAGQERFACYASGGQEAVQLYKSTASHINFTTTCGAAISARNIGWITAAKGQKVKRVINVSAKGFDEATTLTASSGDAQFKVTLGASAVPAGKSGLSTTLTVEYTPTVSDNRVANVEIVLSAGGITKTITVSGRSLPDEFLAITKKNDTWYALPANMNGGENQYEGVIVTPDDDSEPTMVAVAPSTIVYSLRSADNSRYAENGAYVRMAGNGGKALWGNTTADALTIQNSETIDMANAENYEWSLHTTDGIHYTIANPHHADYESGRVLAFGDKFGLYKTSTEFFLVPTGCNSQPLEVNVSARRADATFSWVSNASSVTIALYTDEGKTAFAKSATATSVPYYMTDLTESTHYWFTLTPDGETACAVSGDFETTGPTIDVVEWKVDTVVVFVDKEEHFNPVVIIDGEVEHGAGTSMNATELFFSKYFEGSGDMKLVAIFNGTPNDISLADYSLYTKNCSAPKNESEIATSAFSGSTTDYPISALGTIKSGQEIVFFTRPGTGTLADCSDAFLDKMAAKSGADDNPRWIECNNTTYYGGSKFLQMQFNGNDAICLEKNDALIDVIGSTGEPGKVKNCANRLNDLGWAINVKNIDYGKTVNDSEYTGLYEASSLEPISDAERKEILEGFDIDLDNEYINITTARCILFRDKSVTSGAKAVALNIGATFATCGNHTYEAESYTSEWNGRSVCMDDAMKTAAGVENDAQATCNSYQDLGKFDYSEYYKDWTTIDEQKTLNEYTHNEETGTYEIPIPNLAQYSCLNIRFQLQNDAGEVVTEAPVQVPIIVTGGHATIDDIFNAIVKTDGGNPLYDESIERCQTCDVVVLSDGVLTKATDGSLHDVPEVGNVKVYPGGKLIVPPGTSYSVNSLAFRRQEDEVSTADIQGDLDIKADGNNVYLDVRIDPTNWHYISLPYDCNVSDIRFVGEEIKIPILGTDYLLKYYDGEKRAATQAGGCWEMVKPDDVLKKGLGYIFALPGDGKVKREFRFPMANEVIAEENSDKTISGVYGYGGNLSDQELRPNHKGWNLVGAPYLMNYTSDITDPLRTGLLIQDPVDPKYWIIDESTTALRYIVEPVDNGWSEYRQVAIADYQMKPFTCYFVQIGGNDPTAIQGIEFNAGQVERNSIVRRARSEYAETDDTHPVWCVVNITNPKGEKDETTMLISDQFTDGYDMMDDLVKMRGTYYQYAQITTKPVLASRNNEGEMAFNALPDASAEAGIPLHYFAATQGEYVLAYSDKYGRDEVKAVMLLDKQTNEWHDLMNAPYEFYTNRTDDKDRFVLTIRVERKNGPQITTDIDAASSADDRPRKILYKDHIYILRGEKIYDITGKEL